MQLLLVQLTPVVGRIDHIKPPALRIMSPNDIESALKDSKSRNTKQTNTIYSVPNVEFTPSMTEMLPTLAGSSFLSMVHVWMI